MTDSIRFACAAVALFMLAATANASPSIDAAATCLTDSTNGRDRKDLVKWIFLAMSKHPDIANLAAYSPDDLEKTNSSVGKLFTRLIADDCATEIRAMVAKNGAASISTAFEVLGRVAMVELMSHPDVSAALAGLDKHTDQAKISESMRPRPASK